jgi:cardiolipin synthase
MQAWPVILLLLEGAIRIFMVGVVLLRRRPSSQTLAWILVIVGLPVIGTLLYLLMGEIRLASRRIRQHREIMERIQASPPFVAADRSALKPELPEHFRQIAVLGEAVSEVDALGGNTLKLLGDADLWIDSLLTDIDECQFHCHLLFYIYLADHTGERVAEALILAAQRGVACRLLVDAVGSKPFLRSALCERMRQAGVKIVEALPVNPFRMLLYRIDLRNHRKIVVIDGSVGYTGSCNIADASFAPKARFAPWVDCMVRIQGPVVWDLQMLFVEDWYLDTGESLEDLLNIQPLAVADGVPAQVIGTGPNAFNEGLRYLMQYAIHTAREELIITTPYFVPDNGMLTALSGAACRGVQTALVLPARNDSPLIAATSRSHYQYLLDSGVEVHQYHKGLLHAKTMTIDRSLALISTANLDRRSFELNFEVSLVVFDADFTSQLRFLQKTYMNDSVAVDAAAWRRRGLTPKLWDSAASLMSPLL